MYSFRAKKNFQDSGYAILLNIKDLYDGKCGGWEGKHLSIDLKVGRSY